MEPEPKELNSLQFSFLGHRLLKKKIIFGISSIDISVTHGCDYRPRLESVPCTWQWHELCFSFVPGCGSGIFVHFFLHSIASLINFTLLNSYRLFYIHFFCLCDLCLHLSFRPISTELSAGSCQSHISSFLLNPRDLYSFSASFPHPPQFPVCFRQAAPSNPWRLWLQTTSYIRLCHHQLQPTTCHNRQEGPS